MSQPKVYKDFRPISLLFHLGKLCEQVLVNKLKICIQNSISKVISLLTDQKLVPLMLF